MYEQGFTIADAKTGEPFHFQPSERLRKAFEVVHTLIEDHDGSVVIELATAIGQQLHDESDRPSQYEYDDLQKRNDGQAAQLAAFDEAMREAGRLYGLSWDFIGSDPARAMLHAFKTLFERVRNIPEIPQGKEAATVAQDYALRFDELEARQTKIYETIEILGQARRSAERRLDALEGK